MELEFESNVRHVLHRQMHLMQLCDLECEAAESRINDSIAEAILLLQTRGAQLVTATRSCYSQAKVFHASLHSRAAALLAQIHSPPMRSQNATESAADAATRLLQILDDARAAPLCVGYGGCGVSVDFSVITTAITDLQVMPSCKSYLKLIMIMISNTKQVNITEASYPMPVMAEVGSVSPNAAEINWKFVPDLSSLGGKGVCVICITECPSAHQSEESVSSYEASKLSDVADSSSQQSQFSLSLIASESPFWIDELMPSTRYSVRVGGMPAQQQSRSLQVNVIPAGNKRVNVDTTAVWAWSSEVQFVTPSASNGPAFGFWLDCLMIHFRRQCYSANL
jgi:hypothetical protein